MSKLCDDETMASLIDGVKQPVASQMARIDAMLTSFPEDPRLHLLRGSLLVGDGQLIEGYRAMSRAVELAPDFAIARFQLGLFQLTSGEADNALETWGRLDRLPDGHYLRKFVDGLRALIRDDFEHAIGNLRDGIRANNENLPLNHDMQVVIDSCEEARLSQASASETSVSETSLMLHQFKGGGRAN